MPIASVVQGWTGTWEAVFWLAAVLNAVAAVMALAVLKPMLARHAALSEAAAPVGAGDTAPLAGKSYGGVA